MSDDLLAEILAGRLLDRAAAIWSDSTIPPSRRLDALGDAARDLVEPASACRQLMPALMHESSDEAIAARAAARRAEGEKRAAAQRQHDEQITRVIETDAAKAAVAAAEKGLAEAESVARAYEDPSAPRRERVLARGALEGARRDLDAARARLAELERPPKGTP